MRTQAMMAVLVKKIAAPALPVAVNDEPPSGQTGKFSVKAGVLSHITHEIDDLVKVVFNNAAD